MRSSEEIAAFVFVDIAVIIVVARLMGALFKRIRQPAVVGEIVGGILLGPTLLGALPGHLDAHLFPADVVPHLKTVAQLGLIIFMFIVGLELDLALIRGKERTAAVISLSSVALPFALGVSLAYALHASHDVVMDEDGRRQAVELLPFVLFIGASMSITAFPVLARILTDRGMYRTQIGALTLASAAVDDVLAWSLLALVLAVVKSSGAGDLPRVLLESIAFVTVMFGLVRPQLARIAGWHRREGRLSPNMLAVVVVGFLLSAFLTSKIGIHAIFGAFTFGAIMPRQETHELFREILERLENVSVLILLPVFFVTTGLGVDVTGIGVAGLGTLALIVLVACAGKLVGATVGARTQGILLRKAMAVGVLMNTRGLTELVILSVGREFHVLDDELFTLLVVMAIVTTVMTEPLLRLVYPDRMLEQDVADAQRAALGLPDAYRVVVLVDAVGDAPALVDLAVDLVDDTEHSEVVLTRYRPGPSAVELGSGLQGQLAEMATSLGELHEWAAHAHARGVRTAVFSQFSSQVADDFLAQVVSLDADVVVLATGPPDDPDNSELVADVVREAHADVVVARPGPGGLGPEPGGAVCLDPQAGAGAAAEVAARLARSRGADIRLMRSTDEARRSGPRLEELAGQLTAAGLVCTVVEAGAPVERGYVVAAIGADWTPDRAHAPDGPVLLVRSRAGFDRPGIQELVRSWQTPDPADAARVTMEERD